MLTHFYTLSALAAQWEPQLRGYVWADAYSQTRDELTLAFASPEDTLMLKVSVRRNLPYIFLASGYNRPKRNVRTLFEPAQGGAVSTITMAERDRVMYIELDDGRKIQIMLFGSRPNVMVTDADGRVEFAFQDQAKWQGNQAPSPRPAPTIDSAADLENRWNAQSKTRAHALARAMPFLDRMLATEILHRAGLDAASLPDKSETDWTALFDTTQEVEASFQNPQPAIYWQGERPRALSLTPLTHPHGWTEEAFGDVGSAVSVFVRRTLALQRFDALYTPLESALQSAVSHHGNRAEAMLEALSEASRADRYEHWGHLIMASPAVIPKRADEVLLPDLFNEGQEVRIPLDPNLTAIENGERYYERARNTREARSHAERRLGQTLEKAETAKELLEALQQVDSYDAVRTFKKEHGDAISALAGRKHQAVDRLPFRRYELSGGYEVWVGKNARQNDELTFHHARKFDYWLHARGVTGSHTVLRRPGRQHQPGNDVLEKAAAIAAYHSKARGSSLVPVIYTERKYVRKPKGAVPGAVLVEREKVLLVEPVIPKRL